MDLFILYNELLKFSGFYIMQEHLGDFKVYINKDENSRRLVVSIWFFFNFFLLKWNQFCCKSSSALLNGETSYLFKLRKNLRKSSA